MLMLKKLTHIKKLNAHT